MFLNLYGCTEAAGDSSCFEMPHQFNFELLKSPHAAASGFVPIGRPISQTCIILLNTSASKDTEQIRLPGENQSQDAFFGEICIGGCGVCLGHYAFADSSKKSPLVDMDPVECQLHVSEGRGTVSDDWIWNELSISLFRTGDLGCFSEEGIFCMSSCFFLKSV